MADESIRQICRAAEIFRKIPFLGSLRRMRRARAVTENSRSGSRPHTPPRREHTAHFRVQTARVQYAPRKAPTLSMAESSACSEAHSSPWKETEECSSILRAAPTWISLVDPTLLWRHILTAYIKTSCSFRIEPCPIRGPAVSWAV